MGSPTTESGFLYLVSLIPLGQRMRVGPMKLVVACCGPPVFPAADISHRHRAGSHGLVGLAEVGMNPNLFTVGIECTSVLAGQIGGSPASPFGRRISCNKIAS